MLSVMDEPAGWSGQDYLWDPYRLMAVGDTTQACVGAADPDSLVAPVLPGPALPSTAAFRSCRAMCKVWTRTQLHQHQQQQHHTRLLLFCTKLLSACDSMLSSLQKVNVLWIGRRACLAHGVTILLLLLHLLHTPRRWRAASGSWQMRSRTTSASACVRSTCAA